ncbi:MAG: c-type cytochrome [Sulfurimonas sp.]|jgi:cytochrome c553
MKILISVALALLFAGCSSDTKQETEAVKQETPAKVESAKNDAVAAVETAKEETAVKVEEVKEVKEAAVAKVEEIKQAVSTQVSGATLYQVCAGCHGADASKPALGKSQIIKGWDAAKIADALHGYKAGTYGGAMKNIMVGQVTKLSDEDIKAVSEHISKL